MNYSKQAGELKKHAEVLGLHNNYLFITAYDRYIELVSLLDQLQAAINETGTTVTKEYVKGRENICINPAISEYNKTVSSANATMKSIITLFKDYPRQLLKEKNSKLNVFIDDVLNQN